MTTNLPERFDIPVITLPNVAFFTGTSMPLYIVDDIFQDIFEDATCAGKPVGIALANEDSATSYFSYPCDIFGMGQPLMLERVDNNTLKVLVRCIGKCVLNYPTQSNPYPIYNVTVIKEDCNELSDLNEFYRLENILYRWLEVNITNEQDRDHFIETLAKPEQIVNYTATFIIKNRLIRQILLEMDSLNERIKALNTLITDDGAFQEDYFVSQAFLDFIDDKYLIKHAN